MCDSLCDPLRHRHRTSGVLLKASNRSARQPCNADSPAYPALAISTLVPAVIGIATTILSAVLVWTIKSGDPFKKGSATCLKVLGILFVVQAATSLYAGSLKTSVSMFGGEGAVGAQEIASSFDWTSLVLGIVLFMLSQLFLYARELYLDSGEIA